MRSDAGIGNRRTRDLGVRQFLRALKLSTRHHGITVSDPSTVTTFLFADIEGSTRLWAEVPEQMRLALAAHDAHARSAVEAHRGTIAKMTGDGVLAAFTDPIDAVGAARQFLGALCNRSATADVPLRVRCGLHLGVAGNR